MADNSVFIEGFAGQGIPDFAREATLKGILREATKNSGANDKMVRLLSMMASGQKISSGEFKNIQKEIRKQNRTAKDQLKATQQQNAQDKKANVEDKKQTSLLSELLVGMKTQTQIYKDNFKKQMELERFTEKQGGGVDLAGTFAKVAEAGKALTDGFIKVAAGVMAANNYVLQQGLDRFNFAQELRQSGLAAGLDSTTASLTGFANMVRENSFTLGEAAEFTKRFSKAVGVTGVESALNFANNMAEGGDGADMMRRFGMEFGEVANISGEYLETVRSLGMLDRLSQSEMRAGMEDFMDAVVTTSNVMKINMEDAAMMIKQTLSRDDITAMLGTMDPRRASQVQEVVGLAGGMESAFGEAIAQRLAAGSQTEFMQTKAFQDIASSPIAMELLPVIERLATATERGGVAGYQTEFANLGADIERLRESAQSSRVLITSGADQFGTQVLSSLLRLGQTADDAAAGFVKLSDNDIVAIDAVEVQRRMTVAMEGVNNAIVEQSNFAENIGKLNEKTMNLLNEAEQAGVGLAGEFAGMAADFTTFLQGLGTDAITGALGLTNTALGSLSEEAGKAAENIEKLNSNILTSLTKTSPTGSLNLEKMVSEIEDVPSSLSNRDTMNAQRRQDRQIAEVIEAHGEEGRRAVEQLNVVRDPFKYDFESLKKIDELTSAIAEGRVDNERLMTLIDNFDKYINRTTNQRGQRITNTSNTEENQALLIELRRLVESLNIN